MVTHLSVSTSASDTPTVEHFVLSRPNVTNFLSGVGGTYIYSRAEVDLRCLP